MSATRCRDCEHSAHLSGKCEGYGYGIMRCSCLSGPKPNENMPAAPTTFTLRQQVALAVLPEFIRRCRYVDVAAADAYAFADIFLAAGGEK